MTSRESLRKELASLRRRSDKQLKTFLANEGKRVSKLHYVGTLHARTAEGRETPPISEVMHVMIDNPMLVKFRKACRGDESPDPNDLIETVWDDLRKKLCEEYDLCAKLHRSEVLLDLMQIALIGVPEAFNQIIGSAIILGFRRGPKWMCNCSGRERHAH